MHIICPKETDASAAQFVVSCNWNTIRQFVQRSEMYEWHDLKRSEMQLMQNYWTNTVFTNRSQSLKHKHNIKT